MIKDGGPAFPSSGQNEAGMVPMEGSEGMSLRDWLAGQALTGMAAYGISNAGTVAAKAYAYADAMLEQRKQ